MDIINNYLHIINNLPKGICVVAVSKTKPNQDVLKAYDAGCRVFGENKVQDLVYKYETLPKDIRWHFIGHLQTNKVKYIAPFVSLIHGIDSFKILKAVNKEGVKNNKVVDCLLQFHIAREETKYGLSIEEADEILSSNEFEEMKNIRIKGVMGMATYSEDENMIREEFASLKQIFNHLKTMYFSSQNSFSEISMGMSNDYNIAVEEGSTMVRIGSLIFGERHYSK